MHYLVDFIQFAVNQHIGKWKCVEDCLSGLRGNKYSTGLRTVHNLSSLHTELANLILAGS